MNPRNMMVPHEVDDLTATFPASVKHLMPDVPAEFRNGPETKWHQFQADWFFRGIKNTNGLTAREGIDKQKALRHLRAINASFEPKHEDKEAAVAYLASLWFTDDSTWEVRPREARK